MSRERFEEWAKMYNLDVARATHDVDRGFDYAWNDTDAAWRAWQAALAGLDVQAVVRILDTGYFHDLDASEALAKRLLAAAKGE